jgi:phospholipid/cholesterol/gamma-HCH transport system substrate-binding protein
MSNLTTELKVGLFTVFGLVILVTTAVTLGGNPFESKKQHFYVLLPNANGVAARTQVRTSGVEVGAVTSVKILGNGAKIEFDVDKGVDVPKDSVIEVKARGILGDVYIEIQRNLNEKTLMHSGEELKLNPESNDLETLLATLNSVARDIKKVSTTFADVMGNKNGQKSLQDIVDNIHGITQDLHDVTSSQKQNIKETIQGIRDSAVRIAGLLERNDSKIDEIISDVKLFTTQMRKLSNDRNREGIEDIIANVNEATASLKNILAKVEHGEGTIGQLVAKDDTAEEIKTTLKNIQEVIKPIAELKLTLTDKAEYRVANAQSGDKFYNQFDLKFATRPDRYYLFGITTAPYAREVKNMVTTTTVDGNKTVVSSQQNTPENVGTYRFNAQISQRFSFIAVRLGLFSSSAGFATDFYAFHDRLIGSVELSQFNGDPIPSDTLYGNRGALNIKAYANFYFTPNLFVTGGVDGLVLNPSPFPFVGAGLSITDDDIKGLFGVAALGSSK